MLQCLLLVTASACSIHDPRAVAAKSRLLSSSKRAAQFLQSKHSLAGYVDDALIRLEAAEELESIAGFFEPALVQTLLRLDARQRGRGVQGGVGEIGVYHGRGFIPLALLRRPGERAVAVDVFEQQQLNQDNSGEGDRLAFESSLLKWGITEVSTLCCDSTTLEPSVLRDAAGGPLRLLSVDGSHTAKAARSDLELAAAVLTDGGVVLLDDACNPDW